MNRKAPPRALAAPLHAIELSGWADQQAVVSSFDMLRHGSRAQRRQMLRTIKRDATRGDADAQAILAHLNKP